jgi:hypothetical protein
VPPEKKPAWKGPTFSTWQEDCQEIQVCTVHSVGDEVHGGGGGGGKGKKNYFKPGFVCFKKKVWAK